MGNVLMRLRSTLTLAVLASLPATPAVRAQTPEGWAFAVTPYMWMAGVSGTATVNTRVAGQQTQSFAADFNDIFNNLHFAVMGSAEVRYGRFGVLADLIYLDLSEGVSTPRGIFNGGSASMRQTGLGLAALYRVIDEPAGWLDFGAGIRPWWVDTSLNLNPGVAGIGRYASNNFSWTDPIIAVRGHIRLGSQFGLTAYGDIGGFGAGSRFTYQVLGTVDWTPYPWLAVRAGWRQLAFDFENGRGTLDLTMSGPILATTFRF